MTWFCSCLNCTNMNMDKESSKVIYCDNKDRLVSISRNRLSAFNIYCGDFNEV